MAAMSKNRLELFSDGVFAIVLTLMMVEFKLPEHNGLAGLTEMASPLALHTLVFFLVGQRWILHHNLFVLIDRVDRGSLWANLFVLFFVTLMPLAAHLASEHPLDPLGAMTLCMAQAGLVASVFWMTSYIDSRREEPNDLEMRILRRSRISLAVQFVFLLVLATLCWISPWYGYLGMILIAIYHLWVLKVASGPEEMRALEISRAG
jgi:uncharacterized membrane protein